MRWHLSYKADPLGRPIADRHYNRQKIGAIQFAPPGRSVVLRTDPSDALWITSWPFAEYVRHAWGGAWVNSTFRNENEANRSSELILEAVAATRFFWDPPVLGVITFVDEDKVRHKRDPGRCYLRAGFLPATCPQHPAKVETCAACHSRTKDGLLAFQLLPAKMPSPRAPIGAELQLALGTA